MTTAISDTTAGAVIPAPAKKRVRRQPFYVLFVLDASGSMEPKAADVRGGFNTYLQQLREDNSGTTAYKVAAQAFNDRSWTLVPASPLGAVPELTTANYRPGGNTALLDALGDAINMLTTSVKTKAKPYGTARCLVIVMTDGQENASARHTKDVIAGKIKRRTDAGNWTFVYLGADLDAWAEAGGLGFGQGNTAQYRGTGSAQAMAGLAQTTRAYAGGQSVGGHSPDWANFVSTASATPSGVAAGMQPVAPLAPSLAPMPNLVPAMPPTPPASPAPKRTPRHRTHKAQTPKQP